MKKILLLLIACGLIVPLLSFGRSVSNLEVNVAETGDKVIITYQLDEKSKIELYFSDTGLEDDYTNMSYERNNIQGDWGAKVSKGKKKKIEWNILNSIGYSNGIVRDKVRFKIVASAVEEDSSNPFSGMFSEFKKPKDNTNDQIEVATNVMPLVVVPKGDVPKYDVKLEYDGVVSSETELTLKVEQPYSRFPSVKVQAIRPDGTKVSLLPKYAMKETTITRVDGDTGKSRKEKYKYQSPFPHVVLGHNCQDGTTELIITICDPRGEITLNKKIRTLRENSSFTGIPESEMISKRKCDDGETIEFQNKYKWEKLTQNFDRKKIIRGVRINTNYSTNNNLYFSRLQGVNLNGKKMEECKSREQGYAYYTMLNTGFKTPDEKYTGIISYLPMANYDTPSINGYDEYEGIGLKMPIALQQKKGEKVYEFYFVEDEVYWAGAEKSNLEIEGIEVYVYDKAATEAEYAKRLDAYNKQKEKIRKEQEEREAQLLENLIGRWSYTDRYGSVTLAFWNDGVDFIAYGRTNRGTYRIYKSGRIYLSIEGTRMTVEMLSNDKMKIIEGGNGEILHKTSNSPMPEW